MEILERLRELGEKVPKPTVLPTQKDVENAERDYATYTAITQNNFLVKPLEKLQKKNAENPSNSISNDRGVAYQQ